MEMYKEMYTLIIQFNRVRKNVYYFLKRSNKHLKDHLLLA